MPWARNDNRNNASEISIAQRWTCLPEGSLPPSSSHSPSYTKVRLQRFLGAHQPSWCTISAITFMATVYQSD
ncbi:hypothetical protein E4T56_gene13481 [Termitomyces sp. T112]|nr:hypothetical protein E4T56_gene13481 [Termitomyces sp. T112]